MKSQFSKKENQFQEKVKEAKSMSSLKEEERLQLEKEANEDVHKLRMKLGDSGDELNKAEEVVSSNE